MRSLGGREEVWHLRAGQAEVGAAEKAKTTGTLSSGLSVGVEHFDGHRSLRLKRRLYTIGIQPALWWIRNDLFRIRIPLRIFKVSDPDPIHFI